MKHYLTLDRLSPMGLLRSIVMTAMLALFMITLHPVSGFAQGAAIEPSAIPSPSIPRNTVGLPQQQATAASTFATTSYADLAGTTFTFVPPRDPNQLEAPGTIVPSVLATVIWSLDVTKATTTTGTCGVYANGALIAASTKTIDVAAKEGTMGGDYQVALTGSGSQVIKLQCKSGDTATFTVNQGQARVSISY